MKTYGQRHYKPADWDFWQWNEFIDELRGDCNWNEGIRTGTDDEDHEYYVRYVEDGDYDE